MTKTKQQLLIEIINYTTDVSRNHPSREMRARAKMVIAYVNLLDAIEPQWREVVAESIPEDLSFKDTPYLLATTPDMEVHTHQGHPFFKLVSSIKSSEPITLNTKATKHADTRRRRKRPESNH